MDIDDFTAKYGVTGEAHQLAEYVTLTEPDANGRRRPLIQRQWAVVVQHSPDNDDDQRTLLIDYRTGTGVVDPDPEEVLSEFARDALEGERSFPEFAAERGNFHPDPHDQSRLIAHRSSTPARLYADWIAAVNDHNKLSDWCASPEMLADLYAVHTG